MRQMEGPALKMSAGRRFHAIRLWIGRVLW